MNKIPVSGLISPIFSEDNYPVIDPLLGIDGLRNVYSTTDRNNIPFEKRRDGMIVGVVSTASGDVSYYKLKPQTNSFSWTFGSSLDWDEILTGLSVSLVPVKTFIENEIVTVPTNYQYLIYGDITVGSGGTLSNNGDIVILNGSLNVTSGTYSGSGTVSYVTIPEKKQYSASFSAGVGEILAITHSLNTEDIVYSVRDGYNFIYPNIELNSSDPGNAIVLTTTGTISNGRINIMG